MMFFFLLLLMFSFYIFKDIEKEDIKKQKLGTEYKQPNLESSSILLKNIINKANKGLYIISL